MSKEFPDWFAEAEGTPAFEFDWLAGVVGEQIVVRMEALGLSRRELAERMGVSPARVTQVLRGSENLTLKTLVLVANALDAHIKMELAEGKSAPAALAAQHEERPRRHARSA
jgi:transcriptional regulator with XRE-family HTH domain